MSVSCSGRRGHALALVVLCALATACQARGPRPADAALAAGDSAAAAAGDPVQLPDLSPGPAPPATRFASDAVWLAAAEREPIDLGRLADREGARGLLEGFRAGHTTALTALAALPYASDAELALEELCRVAARLPHRDVLGAVHGIVARPPEPADPLAPGSYLLCYDFLGKLDARRLSPAEADVVSSTRQLAAQHLPGAWAMKDVQ